MDTPESLLRIRITPQITDKIEIVCLFNGTRRHCLLKKTKDEKSRDTVPFIKILMAVENSFVIALAAFRETVAVMYKLKI
jgi:hypothetical protein